MGIEEMFRDFKLGGYNLEVTRVTDHRLVAVILLICLSYSFSTFAGESIKSKGIAKYVTRPTEPQRKYRRHSSFSIGLHGQNWLDSITFSKMWFKNYSLFTLICEAVSFRTNNPIIEKV